MNESVLDPGRPGVVDAPARRGGRSPTSSSSSFSHFDSAGCVVASAAADWLRLPVLARLSSTCRKSAWVFQSADR